MMMGGGPGSASSSLAQYHAQNQYNNQQQMMLEELQRGNRMGLPNNQMGKRFNMQNLPTGGMNFDQQMQQQYMNHPQLPLSSNAVLQRDAWQANSILQINCQNNLSNSHYKVGPNKMKPGAATSTNFMKNQ